MEDHNNVCPDAEQKLSSMQKENEAPLIKYVILKRRFESLVTDAEQFKLERRRIQRIIKERDQLRTELVQCKNKLVVSGKNIRIQETDLRRMRKQNEDLNEKLELTRMELQSMKQAAAHQNAEQKNLKEQLEQVTKERDSLNERWQHSRAECSERGETITNLQSSLNRKDSQRREQTQQLHDLKQENQLLERMKNHKEHGVERQMRELQKYEEGIHRLKKKIEEQICQKITTQEKPCLPFSRNTSQQVPHPQVGSLQKKLLAQTEELQKTQAQCEQQKQSLSEVAVGFHLCQVTIRDQKEQLKALTAERDMYKTKTEQLWMELGDTKREHCGENQQKEASKSQIQMPPVSPKLPLMTRDKFKSPRLPPISQSVKSSKIHVQTELRVIGTKLNPVPKPAANVQ